MKNYYPIKFDNLKIIQEKVLKFLPENQKYRESLFYIDDNMNKFLSINELKENLIRLNILQYIFSIAFYVVPTTKETGSTIHIDYSKGSYSLNIPILGCTNTWVKFYDSNEKPFIKYSNSGVPYYYCNASKCKEIDKLQMSMPHIINIKKIHNVVNTNKNTRVTLLLRILDTWNPENLQLKVVPCDGIEPPLFAV